MIEEALIYGTCITVCVVSASAAYYLSEMNRETIRQQGIDRRAGTAQTNASTIHQEWWQQVLVEGMKNPQIVDLIAKLAPTMLEKVVPLLNQTKQPGK
jgi:hypothetical protein